MQSCILYWHWRNKFYSWCSLQCKQTKNGGEETQRCKAAGISCPLAWAGESGTPICHPLCSPKPLPASLSSTLRRWTRPTRRILWSHRICSSLLHARPPLHKTHDSGACVSYCHFHQAPATSFAFLCKYVSRLHKMDALVMNKNQKGSIASLPSKYTTVNKRQKERKILAGEFQEG